MVVTLRANVEDIGPPLVRSLHMAANGLLVSEHSPQRRKVYAYISVVMSKSLFMLRAHRFCWTLDRSGHNA